ncbi:endo-1,4-beta-xylanase [Rhizobium sp. NTR19]|uniref:Beta-xylanase n=1 Tax=Neorhizobium turbinariae TaxID=2937795 RepID=A0ABT0INU6_9HYPH|nr:endo-1,4-beta-xylanase [Neorhizobium turbinariae]MCK8779539.1 endo-1,4-beta-xylanase [Neorhizobium turbinariae]
MRRREFIQGSLAVAAQVALPAATANAAPTLTIPYGAAVRGDVLVDDYNYRKALIDHCQLIVAEGSMKWESIHPTPDRFDFYDGDKLINFAEQNGMKMRGHTLVWYAAMPEWALAIKGANQANSEMSRHIETVVGRYRGRIPSWDVVNEAVADEPTASDYLRPNVWLENLGKDYLATAFRRAHASDDQVQLVINEYDIECVGEQYKRRREALLRIVRDLRDRDVPVHAVGLQGHLRGELEIDKHALSEFVSQVKAMGLDVLVTELDVTDNLLPPDQQERDTIVASRVEDFLGAIFDAARPTAIVTWGISDRHTWVPMYFTREDGRHNRPLPLDRNYRPKAMMEVIERFTRTTG